MEYINFDLHLQSTDEEQLYTVLADSPQGQAEGSFRLPLNVSRLRWFLAAASGDIEARYMIDRDLNLTATAELTPDKLGIALFDALFHETKILSLWDQTLGSLRAEGGLRLRIRFDPANAKLAALHGVPWELLRRDNHSILAIDPMTPIVRFLHVARPHRPLEIQPPLRVLVVAANPKQDLDLDHEYGLIAAACGTGAPVKLDFLRRANLDTLRAAFRNTSFHILHFMGHGLFDPATGQGGLALEDAEGTGVKVISGSVLADLLRLSPSLRLAVLNACNTAVSTAVGGVDPFLGVASALTLRALPAVIAMQAPISDAAAVVFSGALYSHLATTAPLEGAVAAARLAVRSELPDSFAWAIPALFMRSPNGRLFASQLSTSVGKSSLGVLSHGTPTSEWNLDYSEFVTSKTQGFMGRKRVFDAISRFVANHRCGYFVLRGETGLGKTALLAEMVRKEEHVHHFNIRGEGIYTTRLFLNNLVGQLAGLLGIRDLARLQGFTVDPNSLEPLLHRVSRAASPGAHILILIDALDEAETYGSALGANRLGLPARLPTGIFVLLTVDSHSSIPLQVECPLEELELLADSQDNLADVREIVTASLYRPRTQAYLAAHGLSTANFCEKLVDRSHGNPLYLSYVLGEIERPSPEGSGSMELPSGIQDYYSQRWRQMRDPDREEWRLAKLPILLALTAETQPMTVARVALLSGIANRRRVHSILQQWAPIIAPSRVRVILGERLYCLQHESFRNFLAFAEEQPEERPWMMDVRVEIAERLWDTRHRRESAQGSS